ncbi:hypothetical protein [Tianweitania sediminis]|uniref:Uncharacterized protein n=1 Tax=Tianweitania sediminis TaxID=1502156 RepID=A0A8J7QZS3_9HYPH|nr:hypothetical protein [Tianweitania sediminis]MBP0439115.1 hypothetical protein [Tianweitania sediminis]
MFVRKHILDLQRKGILKHGSVPMPAKERQELLRWVPSVLEGIANPMMFEFHWEDSGIWLDDIYNTHYPDVGDEEWSEGIRSPVPHEHVWLQTKVKHPELLDFYYIWIIQRRGMFGYRATSLTFIEGTLGYSGIYFELFPYGTPDRQVRVQSVCGWYATEYEIEEYYDQARSLARFLNILTRRETELSIEQPSDRLNKRRLEKGKEPVAVRTTVRIDTKYLRRAGRTRPGTHASRVEHFRRAHTRLLPDGRRVPVRSAIVNAGTSDDGPEPQNFFIS